MAARQYLFQYFSFFAWVDHGVNADALGSNILSSTLVSTRMLRDNVAKGMALKFEIGVALGSVLKILLILFNFLYIEKSFLSKTKEELQYF